MQYAGGQKTGDQDTGGLKPTARLETTVQSLLGLGMEGQKRETGHRRTEAGGQGIGGRTPENMDHEGRAHEDRAHEGIAHEGRTHEGIAHEGRTHEGSIHEGSTQEGKILIWRAEIFKVLATFPIPHISVIYCKVCGDKCVAGQIRCFAKRHVSLQMLFA
jgi:hypothetical protein